MRLLQVASILAGIMCGAAVVGYSYNIGPEPRPRPDGPWCLVGEPLNSCTRNAGTKGVDCEFRTESAFRAARARALAPDEARLRHAVADFEIYQAVWAMRRILETEELYRKMYLELGYWASE